MDERTRVVIGDLFDRFAARVKDALQSEAAEKWLERWITVERADLVHRVSALPPAGRVRFFERCALQFSTGALDRARLDAIVMAELALAEERARDGR